MARYGAFFVNVPLGKPKKGKKTIETVGRIWKT